MADDVPMIPAFLSPRNGVVFVEVEPGTVIADDDNPGATATVDDEHIVVKRGTFYCTPAMALKV